MTPSVLVLLRLAAALAADACDAPRDVLDLPVVDLRDAPAAAGAALLAAFRGAGAAAVVGHGVEVGAALRAGAALFRDAGPGERARLAARGGGTRQRGFLPRGSEAGAARAFEAKEGFAWGASGAAWPAGSRAGAILAAAHANLTAAGRAAVAAAAAAGAARLAACCDGDGDEEALSRLFAYEAATGDARATGSSPHTDWGLVTLVAADDVDGGGGLEYDDGGAWRAARAPAGALVANAGDFFALAVGGVRSPRHRVVLGPEPRLSIARRGAGGGGEVRGGRDPRVADGRAAQVFFAYPDSGAPVPPANAAHAGLSLLACQAPDGACAAETPATFGALIAEKWRQVSRAAPD